MNDLDQSDDDATSTNTPHDTAVATRSFDARRSTNAKHERMDAVAHVALRAADRSSEHELFLIERADASNALAATVTPSSDGAL